MNDPKNIAIVLMALALLVIAVRWLRSRRTARRSTQEPTPRRMVSPVPQVQRNWREFYQQMSPRPVAMVAEDVPMTSGRTGASRLRDMMFFCGTTDEVDDKTGAILDKARKVSPISPDNLRHRAACKPELYVLAERLAQSLAQASRRGKTGSINSTERELVDFFYAVFSEDEPGTVERAFAEALQRHSGGTKILGDMLKNRGQAMPSQPIRRGTVTLSQMPAVTESEPEVAKTTEPQPQATADVEQPVTETPVTVKGTLFFAGPRPPPSKRQT